MVVAREEIGTVLAALHQLPEVDRELVTLVAWDGLSPAEAATVLGLGAATVRVRLHRARKRLRASLDPGPKRNVLSGHGWIDGRPPVPAEEMP